MRSTLIADNGDRLNIVPQPQQQSVMLWSHDKATGKIHQLVVPVDMVGAFTQAIEAAGKVAYREKNGPGTESMTVQLPKSYSLESVTVNGRPFVPGPGVVL